MKLRGWASAWTSCLLRHVLPAPVLSPVPPLLRRLVLPPGSLHHLPPLQSLPSVSPSLQRAARPPLVALARHLAAWGVQQRQPPFPLSVRRPSGPRLPWDLAQHPLHRCPLGLALAPRLSPLAVLLEDLDPRLLPLAVPQAALAALLLAWAVVPQLLLQVPLPGHPQLELHLLQELQYLQRWRGRKQG